MMDTMDWVKNGISCEGDYHRYQELLEELDNLRAYVKQLKTCKDCGALRDPNTIYHCES